MVKFLHIVPAEAGQAAEAVQVYPDDMEHKNKIMFVRCLVNDLFCRPMGGIDSGMPNAPARLLCVVVPGACRFTGPSHKTQRKK